VNEVSKAKKSALRDKTTEQLRDDIRVAMEQLMNKLLASAHITHFASRVEHMNLAYINALGEDFDNLGAHLREASEAFRKGQAAYELLVQRGKGRRR
jgi:hypothetical protein